MRFSVIHKKEEAIFGKFDWSRRDLLKELALVEGKNPSGSWRMIKRASEMDR